MHYSRYLKLVFAVGITAVFCAIAVSFIRNSGARDAVTRNTEPAAASRQENTEGVEYLDFFKGARANFRFQADRHYLGEDGMYHMEGNVRAESLKRGDEGKIQLSGQEVVFDKDKTVFILKGKARFSYQGFSADSVRIEYSKDERTFLIPGKVQFRSERVQGSAGRMSYAEDFKRILLKKEVRVEMRPALETDEPVVILTEELVITNQGKSGVSPGPTRLEQGNSHARADSVQFSLTKDGDFIQKMEMRGNVWAELENPEAVEETQKNASFSLSSRKRSIQADRLELTGFKDLSQMRSLDASGRCRFEFSAADGRTTRITASRIRLSLTKTEKMREFLAEKGAKLEEFSADGRSLQRLAGETMTLAENARLLEVVGGDGRLAEFRDGKRDIAAEKISIRLDSGSFEAAGRLQCILRTEGEDQKISESLFSGDLPVFVRADRMRFFSETNRLFFYEDIKIWQKETVVQAEELILEEGGELRCQGNVTARLLFQSEDAEKRRQIQIGSREMIYEPGDQAMRFSGKSLLQVAGMSVQAETLNVRVEKDGNQLLSITAEGGVLFKQGAMRGTAGRAEYNLNDDVIVLMDHPEVDDPIRGKIEGDKLTFHMADDRIIVENSGQERSITVIK
ncbi:MAG: LptA/OstA family protein [Acidobacteria bacterium]|nr:LptA/OstA family protein [Acidobacteriota bacterium]